MQPMHFVLGLGGIVTLGSVGAAAYLFNKTILRGEPIAVSKEPGLNASRWEQYFPMIRENKTWLKAQESESVSVTTFDDVRLSGIWLPGDKESKKLMIALHGYKSRGENDFSALAHFYHEQGYHVLIVDHRSHGQSEGKYIGFGVLDRKDCKKWIKLGIEKIGEDAEIYLHGISMGGATALMVGGEGTPPQVKGIIADCAFTSAWDVFAHVLKKNYHQPQFPILYLANTYCKRLAGYAFNEVSNLEQIKKVTVPVLFIHGEEDDFVPTDMSLRMYQGCNVPKRLLIVPKAGHGESYYAAKELYENTVKEFIAECEQKDKR